MTDRLDHLRTWSREQLEAALATARLEAMHARSKREREYHSKRVRRLVEVLEGMDGNARGDERDR